MQSQEKSEVCKISHTNITAWQYEVRLLQILVYLHFDNIPPSHPSRSSHSTPILLPYKKKKAAHTIRNIRQ